MLIQSVTHCQRHIKIIAILKAYYVPGNILRALHEMSHSVPQQFYVVRSTVKNIFEEIKV